MDTKNTVFFGSRQSMLQLIKEDLENASDETDPYCTDFWGAEKQLRNSETAFRITPRNKAKVENKTA